MRCCPLIMADEPNLSEGFGWHTTRTTLATPAYLDWRARLNELESLVHWSRGVEVQHVPPNIQRPPECNGALPPPLVAACVDLACHRCQSRRGGFQWPVVGAFTRAECLVSAGVSPMEAWARVQQNSRSLTEHEARQVWSGLWVSDLKVQPGHSIGPRKLWNAGALTRVIHLYLLVSFTYNELVFNFHLFQGDGEPEAGQSVQGSEPLYCRIATVWHPGIQAGPVRSVCTLKTTWSCNRSYEFGFA